MVSIKGRYHWKLIDAGSGKVENEGFQDNTITDAFLFYLLEGSGDIVDQDQRIFLNGYSSALPSYDWRQYYKVWELISGDNYATSGTKTPSYTAATNKFSMANNFGLPGALRTITIIGTYWEVNSTNRVPFSFIELTTPITQDTNQYLYLEYAFYLDFDTTGNINDADNDHIRTSFRQNVNTTLIGAFRTSIYISPYLPPVDKDNYMHFLGNFGDTNYNPGQMYSFGLQTGAPGSLFARYRSIEADESDFEGPMCAVIAVNRGRWLAIGNHPRTPTPSISRIFAHPYSRKHILFNDPGYPPSSQGQLILSGTPTNKLFMMGRVYITKTGDASDITDENFDPADVTVADDTITLTQAFGIDDIVQFSNSGGALPSPLATSTDYYVVSGISDENFDPADVTVGADTIALTQSFVIDDVVRFTNSGGALPSPLATGTDYYVIQAGTTIKVSTSQGGSAVDITDQGTGTHTILLQSTPLIKVSSTEGGSAIDITDQGSGTHTVERQNTGRYRLELIPHLFDDRRYFGWVNMLNRAFDTDGNAYSLGSGLYDDYSHGVSNYISKVIIGIIRYGGYIYTVQICGDYLNTFRQNEFTAETSQPITKFAGPGITGVTSICGTGTYADHMYIATDSGIYDYDLTTPLVAPSLMSITGLIDTNITDLAWDSVNEKLWTGHTTGLSKVDLGTNTATTYTTAGGTGGSLSGLSSDEAHIYTGQITAHNGYVLRAGYYRYRPSNQYPDRKIWLLLDGTGYYDLGLYPHTAGLDKYNAGRVITMNGKTWTAYDVTVTGVGTGSMIESDLQTDATSWAPRCKDTPVFQAGRDRFYCLGTAHVNYPYRLYKRLWGYTVGSGAQSTTYERMTSDTSIDEHAVTHEMVAVSKCPIDAGNGLELHGVGGDFWLSPYCGPDISPYFGWNGAAWELDNVNDRTIPKTSSHSLLDGLTADFNNATGVAYDQQFVQGESFTFMYGPGEIKDNLQRYTFEAKRYASRMRTVSAYNVTPATVSVVVPETSDPDFREVDTHDYVLSCTEGATSYTIYSLPSTSTYTVDPSTDILTVGTNIATGTPLYLTASTRTPYPLYWYKQVIFYAINVSPTTIKIAETYADAIGGTPIDILDNGSGTQYFREIAPATTEYYPSKGGHFIISAADVGKSLTFRYNYTLF